VNPPGTYSKQYLDHMDPVGSNGVNIAKWRNAVNDVDYNFDISGVSSAQNCFELCFLTNDQKCFVFR